MRSRVFLPALLLMLAAIVATRVAIRVLAVIASVVALALVLIVLYLLVAPLLKRKDPYDLGELRNVHRKAEWDEVDEIPIDDDADIVCPNCGTCYGAVLGRCPHCRSCRG